jgi:hypothetical protein
VQAAEQTRVSWQGPVEVDGRLWPVQNDRFVLAPAGKHRLSPGLNSAPVTISDFNGAIESALVSDTKVELSYSSRSRALATLGSAVSSIDVDGAAFWKPGGDESAAIVLPAGQHVVTFNR